MRDAQSKLDQVIAFTGRTIGADEVATVLGLVGRDLLLDAMTAVAEENAPAAFDIAGRAVELGYDLRAVCRELSRMVRDLLVLSVDPSRIDDPEIAGEDERDRLLGLVARFSREDLLRAFDLLARAEQELRSAAQPRYNFEIALLRWIHLRKLVPIEDLIAGAPSVKTAPAPAAPRIAPAPAPGSQSSARSAPVPALKPAPAAAKLATVAAPVEPPRVSSGPFKDAFLAEIRKNKVAFYNMVVAQARTIDIGADRIEFTFSATQRALREQVEQNKAWLESLALQAGGRRFTVVAIQDSSTTPSPDPRGSSAEPRAASPETRVPSSESDRKAALKQQALADSAVQAMLEVFPAEIRDVEEM
jgi:DNA polymerase-3 subunit gamma/tau